MTREKDQDLDRNLANYQIEGENIPFSIEGLLDLAELLTAVIQNETTMSKNVKYQWYTSDGKTYGGTPKPENIQKLGLTKKRVESSLVDGTPFTETVTALGVNATLMRGAIYGFIENSIKEGKIKKKPEMGVVKDKKEQK